MSETRKNLDDGSGKQGHRSILFVPSALALIALLLVSTSGTRAEESGNPTIPSAKTVIRGQTLENVAQPIANERTEVLRPVLNRNNSMPDLNNRFRKSNQATKRNIGSATTLSGTVHVQHIFLSDKSSSWTEFEKQSVRNKMKEAYGFIQIHAKRYNKRVKFIDEFANDVKVNGRIPRDAHADPRWTEVAIALSREESAEKAVQRIKEETNPDNVILCLHVNKSALSYNLAYYKNVTPCYAAERMICFTSYPDGRETSSATYAHEILHLFGAGDLYFPYDQNDTRKTDASRAFPNDVMFRVDYDIYQLNVGAFSAYRIGWADELAPEHLHLED